MDTVKLVIKRKFDGAEKFLSDIVYYSLAKNVSRETFIFKR